MASTIAKSDRIWSSLRHLVEQKDWNKDVAKALRELHDHQSDVVLTKSLLRFNRNTSTSIVERNGDIVVGFYLDNGAPNPVHLELAVGGQSIPSLDLSVGEFAYVFEKTHVYPIISVVYSDLRVNTIDCDHLYVIYALLNDVDRRKLATSTSIAKLRSGAIVRCRGGFEYNVEYNEMPDMT